MLATLKAWEDPAFCKDKLGLDAPLGSIDRVEAQRQRLVAGRRAPVRRDRRPDRRPLAKMLHEAGPGKRGLISICAAGGQGVVAILES